MTTIQKCERCGVEGQLKPTPHGLNCPPCYADWIDAASSDCACQACGLVGVGVSGLCRSCEQSPLGPWE
ncbi:hypothetical protein [Pseudomonas sp. PNPG3]|uniref:hypothetical protein n=1 Tax=Pseudomonas sp. PNPG3 TaxID=2919497 RepID=UPI001FFD3BD4|nr:hypothetical protein [Pseudomonas sp. PNPG3]MCK2122058.1 hypothetical protein [Pseudomonas sp. PNPG3]